MKRLSQLPLTLLPLALCCSPAMAQDALPEAEGEPARDDIDAASPEPLPGEIVVVASRLRGQIDAPQAPIVTLDEADIESYGASSIADLIASTGPQTGSGRGRGAGGGFPVVLFNGQRIANFREFRNIPPEAIRRMQVLPEEVALQYGYSPNQRVINFILKDNFASKTVVGEYHFPTRGGFSENQFEGTLLRINKASRLNLYARANDASMLTEAERGVIQQPGSQPAVAGDPDPARFRSLVPDTRDYIVNASWTTGLGKDGLAGSLGLSAGFTRNDSRSISGLDTVLLTAPDGTTALRTLDDPLTRRSRVNTFQGGVNYNTRLGTWQLTATLDGSHANSNTLIDRRADTSALVAAAAAGTLAIAGPLPAVGAAAVDRATATSDSLISLATLAGRPLSMKAGDVSATLKAGFAYTGIRSQDTRSQAGVTRLKRGDLSTGVNIGIPIASRKNDVLAGLGELSLNFSAGLNRLSDFGTLKDWSAGLTWSPFERLSLQASYLVNQAAPSLSDLGNPQTVTFNVPVFDFVRGETALVSVIGGGNRDLRREQQRDLKLAATWDLPFLKNSNLIVEYFRNRSNDVTSAFPLLTPAIEAAFPGRATRDASGRLVAIDRRPVTLFRSESARLRWGLNLSGSLGKASPESAAGGPMAGTFEGGRRGGGGMGRRSGGFDRPAGAPQAAAGRAVAGASAAAAAGR